MKKIIFLFLFLMSSSAYSIHFSERSRPIQEAIPLSELHPIISISIGIVMLWILIEVFLLFFAGSTFFTGDLLDRLSKRFEN